MDSAAEEALVIGVNVIIFVIALTCAILLLTTVLNMSQAANTIATDTSDSTLMELYGEVDERKYSGTEVLAIIEEYTRATSGMQEKYVLQLKIGTNAEYVENRTISLDDLKKEYKLVYKGKFDSIDPTHAKDEGKDWFVFEVII